MKKLSKKLMIGIGAGIAVVIVAVVVILLLCAPKKLSGEILEASVENTVASVQLQGEETPEYITLMEEKTSVKVLSFEQDGDLANARLLVKAPDLYTAAKTLNESGETDPEALDASFSALLQDAEMVETEVDLTFVLNEDGEWEPMITEEFFDAYYGGILRLRDELYEEALKKEGSDHD
ncbi:MAG: hypothetical protein II337_09250 [Clostridia bacterium]|nr:hypothetical protein [Clostridia bacterium]